jgi:hypothetical protein
MDGVNHDRAVACSVDLVNTSKDTGMSGGHPSLDVDWDE